MGMPGKLRVSEFPGEHGSSTSNRQGRAERIDKDPDHGMEAMEHPSQYVMISPSEHWNKLWDIDEDCLAGRWQRQIDSTNLRNSSIHRDANSERKCNGRRYTGIGSSSFGPWPLQGQIALRSATSPQRPRRVLHSSIPPSSMP